MPALLGPGLLVARKRPLVIAVTGIIENPPESSELVTVSSDVVTGDYLYAVVWAGAHGFSNNGYNSVGAPGGGAQGVDRTATASGTNNWTPGVTVVSGAFQIAHAAINLARAGGTTKTFGQGASAVGNVTIPGVTSPGVGTEFLVVGYHATTAPVISTPAGFTLEATTTYTNDSLTGRTSVFSRPCTAGATGTTGVTVSNGGGGGQAFGARLTVTA